MKYQHFLLFILSLCLTPTLQAQYRTQRPLWVHAGFGSITAEQIQRSLEAVDADRKSHGRRVVVIDNTGTTKEGAPVFRTMGFTEREILNLVNDENGATCTDRHSQGDLGNRWCHAAIVKIIDRSLRAQGLSPALAAISGAAFFIPKEFIIDKNPSASDLVAADLEAYKNKNTKVDISVFGDGAVFITLTKRY